MSEIVADPKLVAFCGLYCGACKLYLKGRCPACHENAKATWCKIRTCCLENDYSSCAACTEFEDPKDCRKFHNLFSKVISFLLRSDRRACVLQIKELGLEGHAGAMAKLRRPSIKP
ncbi:MAG: DUF3795 domain-containing protein [Gemmatimonadota bacterium]|nr:MAG: DUF3795 domain-containing protein [Gemmatimonadota bacterium]